MNRAVVLLFGLSCASACGGDDGGGLFEPRPECQGAEIVPFMGDSQGILSTIGIGRQEDGLDLDGDGALDNQLAGISGLANDQIEASFLTYDLIAPFELFDAPALQVDDCVKVAVYLGFFKRDDDGDGAWTIDPAGTGDCDDLDDGVRPGADEVVGNFLDDDCDGLADEAVAPSDDAEDRDDDGVTIADGDCDDTRGEVHPGHPEVCSDGLDNDCDGTADLDAAACDPYDTGTPDQVTIDPASFDDGGRPLITFTSGEIVEEDDGRLVLHAGPSVFRFIVPVTPELFLDLDIKGATIQADLVDVDGVIATENGQLGGIIDAPTADRLRGLDVPEIGLRPEDSLLDAIFANVLSVFLGLPRADDPDWSWCYVPDIDVDGDGHEIFCDSNPDDQVATVDTCIDGDGTVVTDTADTQCTEALDDDGQPRFRDGVSIELNFATVPAVLVHP